MNRKTITYFDYGLGAVNVVVAATQARAGYIGNCIFSLIVAGICMACGFYASKMKP